MLQYRYQIEHLFSVPPSAFFPPPKVDSAIARLTPYRELPVVANNEDDFQVLVKQSFSQRRKTLRNNLKGMMSSEQIESADIDPQRRAETLSVTEFVQLTNLITTSNEGATHD
jgi:16S rRNA (adenine1518-N6/adenine1519-N6)-dimethyltransferase